MTIKNQIPREDKKWYAVKCKFRCERRLMHELNMAGIETYVPIQKKVRQYASRIKKSEVALIPSHVFVKINQIQYISVLAHRHVYGFLNFSGVLTAIPQVEMDLMRRVVGEFDDVAITARDYRVGDSVEIIGGEFTGVTGFLIEEGNHNFKIELTSLGMGLMVSVEPRILIKVGLPKVIALF